MKSLVLALSAIMFCGTAFATSAPACMGNGQVLPVDNAKVTQLKSTSANGFLARAHVSGKVTQVFPNATGHNHFEITLDGTSTTLEVVYDMQFGGLQPVVPGLAIEACGDYITANAYYNGYKP